MSDARAQGPVRTSGLWPFVPSGQTVVGFAVIAVTAVFVAYPVYYLLQAAFDVGDPEARPPTAYGLDNFAALPRYSEIMLNTLFVAFAATVMALILGFLTAWILNRTNVPFRRTLEQAMAVPYYVTPLLGALAWSLLGAPESGFWAVTTRSSTSSAHSALPGSWRCSRVRSPSS
jgi:iron(III) transport system permease protein